MHIKSQISFSFLFACVTCAYVVKIKIMFAYIIEISLVIKI